MQIRSLTGLRSPARELVRALLAGLASALVAAQPATARQEPTTVEGITVSGEKPQTQEQKIKTFVAAASVKTGTGQLGRWDKEICVVVENVRADAAAVLKDRIAATAQEVGLTVGDAGCKPNIMILATDDAQALLTASVKKNKRAFLDDEWTLRVREEDLDEFIASDQPVRCWFVVKRVTRDGKPYRVGTVIEGRGRIGSTVRADFNHVFIILDVSRIGKVKFPALADYVAMVSLAQISPDAEFPDVPTVLRLFEREGAERAEAEGMTAWDHALLKALYSAPRDAKRMSIQEFRIRRSMEEALGEGQ